MLRTFFAWLLLSATALAADESQQPPLRFTLQIDGRQHEIRLDEPLQLQGVFNNPRVVLAATPTREFTYGQVRFQYPAEFTWEAKLKSPAEKTWGLSGHDFKIMYFVLPTKLTVESYCENLAEVLGKAGSQISPSQRKLGPTVFKGKRLAVTIAGANITMEVYAMPARTGSRLLVLQDSPDDRAVSPEAERALELLSKTFQDTLEAAPPAPGK